MRTDNGCESRLWPDTSGLVGAGALKSSIRWQTCKPGLSRPNYWSGYACFCWWYVGCARWAYCRAEPTQLPENSLARAMRRRCATHDWLNKCQSIGPKCSYLSYLYEFWPRFVSDGDCVRRSQTCRLWLSRKRSGEKIQGTSGLEYQGSRTKCSSQFSCNASS